ncbi:LexA family protein [Jiulongibacter sediminis]|uniref:Peptidase S24 n=1 Tax=Jiulongibacter sediminis TaxID=1605367 RepID=A0A0P7BXF9_9BACT|nr:translesion error-prone DNA polymerase V autoproteolytic subunit [Jiulongibacter sediminis]KPM46797.1 peptidase S24 [Jiulongibacter sediminis]TBX21702.1 peptidase S24 [Jiulongibacter sediminis]
MNNIIQGREVCIYALDESEALLLPLVGSPVNAGFPSPATDFLENKIDLNAELIKNPSTTFVAITNGESMIGAGISDKDILIIDKSLPAKDGNIAVCFLDGEFTLKKLKIEKDVIWLMPQNPLFKPIKVTKENDFQIWGILTYSIQKHVRTY